MKKIMIDKEELRKNIKKNGLKSLFKKITLKCSDNTVHD